MKYQYAFYLQRIHNKERARFSWAANHLNKEVSKRIHEYDPYLKYPNKVALIAKNDSYVRDIYKVYIYAKQRIDRLTYLSNSVKDMGDTLLSMQRAKISMRKDY